MEPSGTKGKEKESVAKQAKCEKTVKLEIQPKNIR